MHLPQQKKKKKKAGKRKRKKKRELRSIFFDLLKASLSSIKLRTKYACSGKERGRKNQKKRREGKGKKEGREGKGEERKERNTHKYLRLFQKNTRKKPHWMRNNPQTPNKQLLSRLLFDGKGEVGEEKTTKQL